MDDLLSSISPSASAKEYLTLGLTALRNKVSVSLLHDPEAISSLVTCCEASSLQDASEILHDILRSGGETGEPVIVEYLRRRSSAVEPSSVDEPTQGKFKIYRKSDLSEYDGINRKHDGGKSKSAVKPSSVDEPSQGEFKIYRKPDLSEYDGIKRKYDGGKSKDSQGEFKIYRKPDLSEYDGIKRKYNGGKSKDTTRSRHAGFELSAEDDRRQGYDQSRHRSRQRSPSQGYDQSRHWSHQRSPSTERRAWVYPEVSVARKDDIHRSNVSAGIFGDQDEFPTLQRSQEIQSRHARIPERTNISGSVQHRGFTPVEDERPRRSGVAGFQRGSLVEADESSRRPVHPTEKPIYHEAADAKSKRVPSYSQSLQRGSSSVAERPKQSSRSRHSIVAESSRPRHSVVAAERPRQSSRSRHSIVAESSRPRHSVVAEERPGHSSWQSGQEVPLEASSAFDICMPTNTIRLRQFQSQSIRIRESERSPVFQCLMPGMVLLKNWLSQNDQVNIVRTCRTLGLGPGGFYQPSFGNNYRMHLWMMCLGKNWDPVSKSYEDVRSYDNVVPPPLPAEFVALARRAVEESQNGLRNDRTLRTADIQRLLPSMDPDICIVNFYKQTGRLGMHQDKDESRSSIQRGLPVVSFSVGDSAEFIYGTDRSMDRAERVILESGDVVIFGGPSRLVFHGITRVLPRTSPRWLTEETNLCPGRINLTFRQL